jgi:P pilus assembly/Cpx signaling pathway, periplasmic inhibitor/zinc-resistance associated protein
MKIRSFLITLAVAGLTAGMLTAQDRPRRGGFGGRGGDGAPMSEKRLTRELGLNAEQSNRVNTILQESRVAQQGNREKMTTLHTSLATAVKNGDEGQIESITREMGNLHQQELSARAKMMAKVMSTLTPDQKTKFAPHVDQMFAQGPGMRRQPPPAVKQ